MNQQRGIMECHMPWCDSLVRAEDLFCGRCWSRIPFRLRAMIRKRIQRGENLRNSACYRELVDRAVWSARQWWAEHGPSIMARTRGSGGEDVYPARAGGVQ